MTARDDPAVLGVITEPLPDDRLRVTLDGTLDVTTRHLLEVAVRACPRWVREVALDLSALWEIGPGGAGALARAYTELVEGGRRVVVLDPSPAVHDLLEMWHLTDLVQEPRQGVLDLRLSRLLAAIVALDDPVVDLRDEESRR